MRTRFALADLGGSKGYVERALNQGFCFPDARLERIHREVCLLLIDHQRWSEPDRICARSQYQHSLGECQILDGIAKLWRRLFRLPVLYYLNADHQALASNVSHNTELVWPFRQAAEDIFAHAPRIRHIALLNETNCSQSRGHGNRIRTKRRCMRAWLPIHDAGWSDGRGERQPRGDAFGNAEEIGFDAGVISRPPLDFPYDPA